MIQGDITTVLWIALAILLGYAAAMFIHKDDLHKKPNLAGKFVINYADLDKDLLGIVLDKDLPEIEQSGYISLEVVVKKDQKTNPENSPGENS